MRIESLGVSLQDRLDSRLSNRSSGHMSKTLDAHNLSEFNIQSLNFKFRLVRQKQQRTHNRSLRTPQLDRESVPLN